MDKITLKRDGLPPLAFTGEKIGGDSSRSHQGDGQNRWTTVHIYRTKSGKFVGHVQHLTCWQGERDTSTASSFATAGELIDWLKQGQDSLGRISQGAVEEAAKTVPEFASTWVETVE